MSEFESIHIIPDSHVPFHDERAVRLNLGIMADRQPDHCVILGDWMDVYTLSRHMKKPEFAGWDFKRELEVGNALMDEHDKVLAHTKNKVYCMGNHEDRFDAYIAQRAPELYGITDIARELNLKKRGWKVVPYKQSYTLGHITYTHDVGAAGADAHLRAEQTFCDNVVIGHTHRLGYGVVGNRAGKPHVAAMMGWLGDKQYADYIHSAASNRYWSLGFGTGVMNVKSGITYVTPHPIVEYTACVDGHVYGQEK